MSKNLTFKQLLWLGFGTVFGLILIANLVTNWSKNILTQSLNKVAFTYKIQQELEAIERLLVEAETGQRGFLYTGRENFLVPYTRSITEINQQILKLKSEIKDKEQQERLSDLEKLIRERLNYLANTIAMKRQGKEQEVRNIVIVGTGVRMQNRLKQQIAEMKQAENQLLVARLNAATQAQNFSTYLAVGSTLMAIGIGVFILLTITRTIDQSLKKAIDVAEQVSTGNLTAQIEVTSQNEVGQLLAAFRIMIKRLNQLIHQVQKSGIQVTTSATQIASAGKELEAAVNEQVASTNQVVATAAEIATTSRQLVKTMEEVTFTSKSTAIAAEGGQRSLNHMETTMQQLETATRSISGKLGIISEKANNINRIITTITKVADQTNLLSLNAAIEAEKAGEYGMGFAVVAREIRRLADQTAVSTLDIEKMVKEMQAAVSTGVMEMDQFSQEVAQSVQDVQTVSWQLMEIIDQVQSLTPRFSSVNQGMESQVEGAQHINEAMVHLSEASVQTAQSLEEINGAIAQLNEAAQGLHQEISRFKIN